MTMRTGTAVAVILAIAAGAGMVTRARAAAEPITIRTLSSRPDRISGGDVLIEVVGPSGGASIPPQVALNGRDVSRQLKKIDPNDYAEPLTARDKPRLAQAFPRGVCEWSKPGVGQVPVITWNSFGPAAPARR